MICRFLALAFLLPSLALAVCSGTDGYSRTVCADAPILYWRMNEASGNLADSSGNSRTGTAVGTATYSQAGGIFGGGTAIKSTSSSNYFKRADEAAFDFGTGAFSAECWMKQSGGTSFGTYFAQVTGSPYDGWNIGSDGSGNVPRLWYNQTQTALTCSAPAECQSLSSDWADVLLVRTGSSGANTLRLYLRCINTGANCYAHATGFLGADAGGYNVNNTADLSVFFAASGFSGGAPNLTMQECALYNTALTRADFDTHFGCGFDGTGCVSSGLLNQRRIFQSRRDPLPTLRPWSPREWWLKKAA